MRDGAEVFYSQSDAIKLLKDRKIEWAVDL